MTEFGWTKERKRKAAIILTVVVLMGVGAYVYMNRSAFGLAPTGPAPLSASSIKVISWTDTEDISERIPVKLYGPDENKIESPDDWDKLYEGLTYWDLIESGDADEISEDLSDLTHVLFYFDYDNTTYFMPQQRIYTISGNSEFIEHAVHLSSDINFNILDESTMGAISVGSYQTDGNFTLEFKYPTYTTSELHYGSEWEISTDDYEDMTQDEKEDLWNENLWRAQGPRYLLSEDTDNDFDDQWEKITQTYGFKFTFNQSLNTTDGSLHQVNMTLDADAPFTKVISGEYIYLLGEEVIDCKYGAYELGLEMTFASNVSISNVHSVRFDVPKEEDSAQVAWTYSAIGA
jgi:hypothetical protein